MAPNLEMAGIGRGVVQDSVNGASLYLLPLSLVLLAIFKLITNGFNNSNLLGILKLQHNYADNVITQAMFNCLTSGRT